MDLTQRKLTKEEWENIETPVSSDEKKILNLIINGYEDLNIKYNDHLSLFSFTKIEKTAEVEAFLYKKYFHPQIEEMVSRYAKSLNMDIQINEENSIKRLKSADSIRIQNLENNIKLNKNNIFEFLIVELCHNLLKNLYKKNTDYSFYL